MCPLHCTCTDPQTTTPQTSACLQVMRSNLLQYAAISYTSQLNVCVSSKSNFRPLQQFPINYQLSITHCPIARFHPSSSAPSHCNQFQTFHSTAIVRHSPEKNSWQLFPFGSAAGQKEMLFVRLNRTGGPSFTVKCAIVRDYIVGRHKSFCVNSLHHNTPPT